MTRFKPLSFLLPALLLAAAATSSYAAISGQESSVSSLSGINEAETYDSTVTSVRTYSQQYEDTVTELATVDAHLATMRANLNTHPEDVGSPNYNQYRTAYFQMLDRAGDLRNKAMALDMLISGEKLNDSSTTGQALTDAEYATLKSRLDSAEKQAQAIDVEMQALQTRLANNDPTASYTELDALYEQADKAYDMAHNLREILNNSTNPDGSPSVVYVPPSTTTGGSNSSGSSSGSGSSTVDAIKAAALQGLTQNLLGGGGSGGFDLNSFGGIQKAISGMNVGGAQVGNIKPDTSAVAAKPQAPVKQTASKDKSCKEAAADASAKAKTDALPERDDSGKIIKSASSGTTETSPGKAADDAVAASTKPDCVGVNYTKKNPGGEDNLNKITSIDEAQATDGQYLCDPANSNCSANGQQCATLTKALTDVGPASTWQKGELVQGNTNIKIGTGIATFNYDGNYGPSNAPGGVSGGSHTGIYMGQTSEGIIIKHQWNGSGGSRTSIIPWDSWNGKSLEAGNKYYVIAGQNTFLGIPWYLPSLLAGLHLIPYGEGLAEI